MTLQTYYWREKSKNYYLETSLSLVHTGRKNLKNQEFSLSPIIWYFYDKCDHSWSNVRKCGADGRQRYGTPTTIYDECEQEIQTPGMICDCHKALISTEILLKLNFRGNVRRFSALDECEHCCLRITNNWGYHCHWFLRQI